MTPIIELRNVSKSFYVRKGFFTGRKELKVLEDLNLSIDEGDVLALVGESGCGKTTTAKIIAGLVKPTSGELLYRGKDVWSMDKEDFLRYRRAVQIVHQDPYSSLNPTITVYDTLRVPLLKHNVVPKSGVYNRVLELLETVDLTPPEEYLSKYPHQLSGGERQRVTIARALTVNPEFIVADEPVSMLDVSIRLGIIELLRDLKEKLGVSYLFVTHDLAMAKYFALEGKIAVMYLGKIVEYGNTKEVIDRPLHPYTQALLKAIPEADPEVTRKKEMPKLRSLDVPSFSKLPKGCRFHPRCPEFLEGICDVKAPSLSRITPTREVACWLYHDESGRIRTERLEDMGVNT